MLNDLTRGELNEARLLELHDLADTTPAGECTDDYRRGYEAAMNWVKVIVNPDWYTDRVRLEELRVEARMVNVSFKS
jgi:hypothetical protein